MAKLGARGRVEVFRVAKNLPDDGLSTDRVERFALMSDRTILRNLVVRFRAAHGQPARLHNYGWKRYGAAKAGMARALFDKLTHAKYVQEGVADFSLIPGEADAEVERATVAQRLTVD